MIPSAKIPTNYTGRDAFSFFHQKISKFHPKAYKTALIFAALCCFVFPGLSWAATPTGTIIANQAQITLTVSGKNLSLASNTDEITVEAPATPITVTESEVTLLHYDPDGGTNLIMLPVTKYDTGGGVFVDVEPPLVPGSTTELVTDAPLAQMPAAIFRKGQTLFVEINDADNNIDPNKIDTIEINVATHLSSNAIVDKEKLLLNEIAPDSGMFAGYIPTSADSPEPNDGRMEVETDSSVHIHYIDADDSSDSSTVIVLIDPYGKAFDSATGQPLDGVTVSLINNDTGQPATVYGDDGVSAYPATMTTGSTVTDSSGNVYEYPQGTFRFPFSSPGEYRLEVSLPSPSSGYLWPSTAKDDRLQSLPGFSFAIDTGSRGEVFTLKAGAPLLLDIPIDPIDTPLYVRKTASKTSVAIGDFLQYRVEIENTRTLNAVYAVRLIDVLPHGFRYQSGSVRVNDATATEPEIAADGRTLTFNLGEIATETNATITYVTRVGAVRPGKAINQAYATADGGLGSNTAKATVEVREDLMRSRSILTGRVVLNKMESDENDGVSGVRIYIEDGTYTITDSEGKFHFEGMRPGTHVVQLDLDTLPAQYEVELLPDTDSTRFAGRAWSKFIDLQGGTLWNVDFNVVLKPKQKGDITLLMDSTMQSAPLGNNSDQATQNIQIKLTGSTVPIRNARLIIMLPSGAKHIAGSSALDDRQIADPKIQTNILTYRLGDQPANWKIDLTLAAHINPEAASSSELITKAVLLFDTPAKKNERTPLSEHVFLTEQVEKSRHTEKFTIRPRFGPLGTTLGKEDKIMLKELISKIADLSDVRLQIIGYSDNLPIRKKSSNLFADNYALSLARAKIVAHYLRDELGLTPMQTTVLGKGPENPVAENTTPEGRALNRHVHVQVLADRVEMGVMLKPDQRQIDTTKTIETTGLRPGEIWDEPEMAAPKSSTPTYDKVWIETVQPGIEWLFPAENHLPPIPSIHVGIKHAPADKISLLLNGEPVNNVNFEYTIKNKAGSVAFSLWRGIDLVEGDNQMELVITDADGRESGRLKRMFHYSGPPVRAKLVKSQSVLVADGLTKPVVAVQLFDRDGYPAREGSGGEFDVNPPYQAQIVSLYKSDVMPGAPEEKLRYTIGKDGVALITLQPTTEVGDVEITIPLITGDYEILAPLKPVTRDWIIVGFAEGTAGYNTLSGNTESLARNAAEEKLYQDGQAAFYAKGRIKGKWLLTIAYDNKKKTGNSLYQTIDPGTYYTLYGDNSTQRYDASSSKKLYLKIEREKFFALFGDYDTGLTVTELSRYSRSLTGVKSRYRDDRYELVMFASESNQAFVKDEIRGQGITGIYQLSRQNIVMNSEKVTIQVRDRFRSEVIISEREMTRHSEYDIDYENGSLTFREAVFSRDSDLNPVFIVVDYESYDTNDRSLTYGGRAQVKIGEQLKVGLTRVNEGRLGEVGKLTGVDATYRFGEETRLRLEYAQSTTSDNSQDNSGSAYLAEVEHRSKLLDTTVYLRENGKGFGLGQINGSENGTRKIGADGTYRITDSLNLRSQFYRQSNLATGADRNLLEAETRYQINSTNLHAGLRIVRDELGNGKTLSSDLITAGVAQRVMNDKLNLRVDREQALGGSNESADFPSRTRLGADYLFSTDTSLFVEQEWADGASRSTRNTLMGIKTIPWRGANISTSVSRNSNNDTENTLGGMSLRQQWTINPQWSLDAGIEQSIKISSKNAATMNVNVPPASGPGSSNSINSNSNDFTATSLGATYLSLSEWIWTGRAEYRDATIENKWNFFTSVQSKSRTDIGLLLSLQVSDNKRVTGEHSSSSNLRLGLAYRPLKSRWLVLNKLDWIQERSTGIDLGFDNWRIVNNLNANYRLNPRLQTSLQYGAKFVRDTINDISYEGYTDLIGLESRYDITKNWDIGLRANVLHAWELNQYDYSYGASIGHSFIKNIWISAGYNFAGFRDDDFSGARYSSKGPFVQFRMKFDQQSVREVLKWVSR